MQIFIPSNIFFAPCYLSAEMIKASNCSDVVLIYITFFEADAVLVDFRTKQSQFDSELRKEALFDTHLAFKRGFENWFTKAKHFSIKFYFMILCLISCYFLFILFFIMLHYLRTLCAIAN